MRRTLCRSHVSRDVRRCALHGRRSVHEVCIVGSGPAALYCAERLREGGTSGLGGVGVTLVESLHQPFGLVRWGVAPDHGTTRNVMTRLGRIPRLRWFGGVQVGTAAVEGPCGVTSGRYGVRLRLGVPLLRQAFDAVVLAYGAQRDRPLPALQAPRAGGGDHAPSHVIPARCVVSWYNGLTLRSRLPASPCNADDAVDLARVRSVVIVGNGNVALDVARMLTRPVADLEHTDVDPGALQQLKHSGVTDVHVVGRRGPVAAACTTKELRELSRLATVVVHAAADARAELAAAAEDGSSGRAGRRRLRLWQDLASEQRACDDPGSPARPRVHFHFWRQVSHVGTDAQGRVCDVAVSDTGPSSDSPSAAAVLPCDLLVSSIGFTGHSLEPGVVPLSDAGTVPNDGGRVHGLAATVSEQGGCIDQAGVYVTGWLRRGATGIIGTNVGDGQETADAVLEDLARLKPKHGITSSLARQLNEEAVRLPDLWNDPLPVYDDGLHTE